MICYLVQRAYRNVARRIMLLIVHGSYTPRLFLSYRGGDVSLIEFVKPGAEIT